MLGLGLGLPQYSLRRAASIWTPAALFAQGQQGVWYEPKPEYLYQDRSASTSAADGDPVGLMLDKHLGLALQQEFAADFSSTTGWTFPSATTSFSGGNLVFDSAANNDWAYHAEGGVSGALYEITYTIESIEAGGLFIIINNGGGSSPVRSSPGTYTETIGDYAGSSHFWGIRASGASTTAVVSSFSVKEVVGRHAVQGTSADRLRYSSTPPNLVPDDVADQLNVTLPAIAAATVAIATPSGADIQYPVDLSSGSYVIDYQNSGVIILDREFTADETQKVTDYLNARAGV